MQSLIPWYLSNRVQRRWATSENTPRGSRWRSAVRWINAVVTLLLLSSWQPSPLRSDTLEYVLGAPQSEAKAGDPAILPLYIHNSGDRSVQIHLPDAVACQLINGRRSVDLLAIRVVQHAPARALLASRQFMKALYRVDIPDGYNGNVRLSIDALGGSAVYFPVARADMHNPDRFAWLPRTTDQPLDSLIQLYQPYIKNISYYEPMYFLAGTEPEYSKFQISLKYRFFNPEKAFVKQHPWVQGFHFGYTQTSFWNLSSDSAPFEDTSYKPELFYISPRLTSDALPIDGLFIKGGVRHESNGRGGSLSRGTNTVYIEPLLAFYDTQSRLGLKITPRIFTYFNNEDENNPDLDRYRGHFNLGVTFGKAESWVVDTHLGLAAEGASVQVDVTYPLHQLFFNPLDIYLQAQYVNVLAESLLNYTQRTEAFRIGFAIVR